MSALFGRAVKFARSPQGKRIAREALRYAQSPKGRAQIQRAVEKARSPETKRRLAAARERVPVGRRSAAPKRRRP